MKLKLLSLNLWDGGKLINRVFDFIDQVDADIMCLQEAVCGKNDALEKNYRSVRVLSEMFPNYDYYFSPEVNKQFSSERFNFGNLILSKYPILKYNHWFFDEPYLDPWVEGKTGNWQYPSSLQHTVVGIKDKTMDIFNIHGIWGYDGYDNPRRSTMSRMIIKQIHNKSDVILAGDFNCFPETDAIQDINRYLTNVFEDELTSTFNVKHKQDGDYATSVVDMVFASDTFSVVKRYQPQVDVSDHLPLVVEFEWLTAG